MLLSIPLPFPIDWLPQPAYLVGGAVRDQIRRQLSATPAETPSKLDLDLVLERSPLEWASQTARRLQAGYVVLDSHRQIARIVMPQITLDVALQVGEDLVADLHHRDFTCNAIALELHSQTLIDPLEGVRDIDLRQIRMVHPDNLSADPLRLLRAYRQAAQLGFDLDPATRLQIQQNAPQMARVAGERVRTELSHLLAIPRAGLRWLQQAWQDGVLHPWLPRLQAKGFERAQILAQVAPALTQIYPRSFSSLQEPLTDQRTLWMTLLLVSLLQTDPQLDQTLEALRYSRAERRVAQKLQELHPQFCSLVKQKTESLDREEYYLFYEAASTLFPGVALLARVAGVSESQLHPWLKRFEDPQDPLAHQVPLVDGRQVMQTLGIRSGPRVGKVLAAVRLAQAKGEISTPEEALQRARQEWQSGSEVSV